MDRYIKAVFVTALISLLSSCGGGGSSDSGSGGGSSSTPPTEYPLNNAISAFEQSNHSYTLHATSGSNSFTLEIAWAAGSIQSFGGVSAYTSTRTVTLFEGTTLLSNNVAEGFYLLGPFEPLGSIDTNGQVAIATNQTALPSQSTTGTSGAFDTLTIYTDSTLTSVYGHETNTWSLNAASGTDASLCLNSVGTLGGNPYTESDCYTIDSNGNVLGLTASVDVSGTVLNFQ